MCKEVWDTDILEDLDFWVNIYHNCIIFITQSFVSSPCQIFQLSQLSQSADRAWTGATVPTSNSHVK